MPWWTIVCCGVFGILVLPASLFAIAGTIRALRSLARLGTAAETIALDLSAGVEALSARSEAATANAQRVQASLARLQASRARVDVLLWALQDVRRLLAAYRWLNPTK